LLPPFMYAIITLLYTFYKISLQATFSLTSFRLLLRVLSVLSMLLLENLTTLTWAC